MITKHDLTTSFKDHQLDAATKGGTRTKPKERRDDSFAPGTN